MEQIILDYIIEQFGEHGGEIKSNTSLLYGGYIDSFSMVVVLIFIEKTFGIKIPEKQATHQNFESVDAMVALIKSIKECQ